MKKPLRVMHFHFGRDGGAERFFVHLIDGLAEAGVEQMTVIRPNRVWRASIEGKTEIIESHYRNASLDHFTLPKKIRKLAAQWKPDAMIAWTPKGCRLMPSGINSRKIVRFGDYPRSTKRFDNVDLVITNTPGILERVKSLGWKKPAQVITNFSTTEKVAPLDRSTLGITDNAPIVFASGRFVSIKGFDVLIRALAPINDAHLVLAGDGEEKKDLQKLVAEMGMQQRVHFPGWLNDCRAHLAMCNLMVLPSRHEPLGNVILEAWGQGVPVIATRSEGPSWFVNDETNGVLVNIDDHGGLTNAIMRVLDEKSLREKLIAGGFATSDELFSREKIVSGYIDAISGH